VSSYLKRTVLAAVLGTAVGTSALAADAAAPSIDITGFVDTYYTYNFNDPANKLNGLHVFNPDHNALSLALAELAFEKKPTTDSRAGFRVDFNFGPGAELTNFFEPSKDAYPSLGLLEQAYVSFLAGDKIQVDFGKFVTPVGNELVESKDNWNYTRSVQFGWAIPFYHSGARATFTASDKFTLAAYLVNGWNNVIDNNNDKTFIGQFILKPSSKFTLIGNAVVGKEIEDTRTLFDAVVVFNLSDKFALASEIDFGSEGDAKWSAYSAYAKLTAGSVAFTLRGEMLDDEDGWATLGTTVTSGTLTTEFKLGGGVIAKLDLRTDMADAPIFVGEGTSTKDSQTTVTLGLVYAFGGKI
jgi:hypothetical protein